MSAGRFAQRPAGALPNAELAGDLRAAHDRLDELRRELGQLRARAADTYHAGLVELDIGRALTALGAARLALDRGRRHAELEP